MLRREDWEDDRLLLDNRSSEVVLERPREDDSDTSKLCALLRDGCRGDEVDRLELFEWCDSLSTERPLDALLRDVDDLTVLEESRGDEIVDLFELCG